MKSRLLLTGSDVRRLCREGRVGRDPRYHAEAHHLRYARVVALLANCSVVRRDPRPDAAGGPRYPRGYIALAQDWRRRTYRIDFNLGTDAGGGDFMYVVTAMELGWRP